MTTTPARSVPELLEEIRAARADVARHKAAIRSHRSELGAAAERLAALEAECRRRGIALIDQPSTEGVARGELHGRQERTRSHY